MRFVLLHYHFLKNAGSTVENILDRNFGSRFLRIDTADRNGHFDNASLLSLLDERPDLAAISSHQIRHPLPLASGYLFFDICFLRDPIDRIRSIYEYFRQKPSAGDPFSEIANRCGLGDYLACLVNRFPAEITNVQVALLANGGVDEQGPGERDFQVALERMLDTTFLGVVDQFEKSVSAGRWMLDPIFPGLDCAEPPANVSGGLEGSVAARRHKVREACGRQVYAELLRRNALDCELVRRARAEVRRRADLSRETKQPPCVPVAASADDWISRAAAYFRLRRSGLFDSRFYLERYPDIRGAGIDPLWHYIRHGAAENRKPNALFQPDYYLRRCPEARTGNPLLHFLANGMLQPHPLFDSAAYAVAHPEAADHPLRHYMRSPRMRRASLEILDVAADIASDPPPEQRAFFRAVKRSQWRAANGIPEK